MRKAIVFLVSCAAALGLAKPVGGQSPLELAVAASYPLTQATADRSEIVTAGAVMTLKKSGVIMFATTASTKATLNYKDGKISPSVPTRMAAFSMMGKPATNIVQRTYVAGEKLWLIGIQAAGDSVTLQFLSDPVGDVRYAASIKFPFPKGATPTSQQVIAQIGEVIAPDGGAAPSAPAEAPIVAPPPPGGPSASTGASWRIQPATNGNASALNQPTGNEAAIAGFAKAAGRQTPAVMALTCTGAEIRVRRKALPTPGGFLCMDMDGGYENAKFSVGGRPMEQASLCTDDPSDNDPPVLRLPIDLGGGGIDEVVASPGQLMTFSIDMTTQSHEQFTAQFQLPQDGSPIAFLSACSQKAPGSAADACPVLDGKGLRTAELLTASGKPYTGTDSENTIGVVWNIPKPTKARPVRPALHWLCSYGDGLKQTNDKEALTKRVVPVSSKVAQCSHYGSATMGDVRASCS